MLTCEINTALAERHHTTTCTTGATYREGEWGKTDREGEAINSTQRMTAGTEWEKESRKGRERRKKNLPKDLFCGVCVYRYIYYMCVGIIIVQIVIFLHD